MGTHATISVEHVDGTVSTTYLHYDGYLSHAGKMLQEHYNTLAKAEELVSHGHMSSLYERIYPVGEHSFENPEKGTCVFYGRDRGEQGVEPTTTPSVHSARLFNREEYNYLFMNGKWHVSLWNKNHYVEL